MADQKRDEDTGKLNSDNMNVDLAHRNNAIRQFNNADKTAQGMVNNQTHVFSVTSKIDGKTLESLDLIDEPRRKTG